MRVPIWTAALACGLFFWAGSATSRRKAALPLPASPSIAFSEHPTLNGEDTVERERSPLVTPTPLPAPVVEVSSASPGKSADPVEWHEIGKAYDEKNWALAEDLFAAFSLSHGADYDFLIDYGYFLADEENPNADKESAIRILEQAARLDPSAIKAYLKMATTFQEMGRLAEADSYLRKALDLDPNAAAVWIDMGYVALKRGNLDEGETYCLRAERLGPTEAQRKVIVYNLDWIRRKRAERAEN